MLNNNKYKILFVCLGNICRSPAGEGIMKHLVEQAGLNKQIEIDSAGTSGWHNGELPDSRMRKHGKQRGYNFDTLSRQFVAKDYDDFDLILVMDDSNYDNVIALSPDIESRSKVYRMTDFLQNFDYDHIPDPYYMGSNGFELVLDLLEDACDGLLKKVQTDIK